jgi:hypothetical protein
MSTKPVLPVQSVQIDDGIDESSVEAQPPQADMNTKGKDHGDVFKGQSDALRPDGAGNDPSGQDGRVGRVSEAHKSAVADGESDGMSAGWKRARFDTN